MRHARLIVSTLERNQTRWVPQAAVIRKAYLGIVVATGVKAGRPVWLEMVRDVGE
jgi:hypothetical protein